MAFRILSPLLLVAALLPLALSQCISGVYELEMNLLFTPANFPTAPTSSHLSPLTAFSHTRRFSAFVPYGYSTPGVKSVAETGDTTALLKELKSPLVKSVATTKSAAFTGDVFKLNIPVDCKHPYLSAISMLAPSPDWIVALFSVDMRGSDGKFVPSMEGELPVWDAGTDAGKTLNAADKVSKPVENISPLEGAPLNGRPAASYTLTLKGAKMPSKPAMMKTAPKKTTGKCRSAKYRLTVKSLWTARRFKGIPDGAMFSPLTAASHSQRFSALTLFGYATPGVQSIAETGDNSVLVKELTARSAKPFIKDIVAADGPTMPGKKTSFIIEVDCQFSVITFLQMVAPSPDWIIAGANLPTFVNGKFVGKLSGALKVYDAGTDSGETLLATDDQTTPRENISPLMGSPFNGKAIAKYVLKKL